MRCYARVRDSSGYPAVFGYMCNLLHILPENEAYERIARPFWERPN